MSRPLRVLFVITSLDRGGAQRQVVDIAIQLHAVGWPVAILSMTTPVEYLDEVRAAGIKVLSLHMTPGHPSPSAFVRYGRFVRHWRPDVIHSHMVHANLMTRLGRVFAPRTPLICTVHNVNEGARWREVAYRITDRLATATTAVSEAAVMRYLEVGAAPSGRIVAVPNGFDFSRGIAPDARRSLRAELGIGDAFLWITAGRLDYQKGYDILLEAFDRVRRERPGSRLAMAGDGPERADLERRLEVLDLGGAAALLGDRRDVPSLLAAADGFVLSSRWEGLPMVLLEACAQGVPIVSTDVGGNREIVRPELGGVLVGVDAAEIAEAMLQVMRTTPEERARVGAALRRHVHSVYDLGAVVERWKAMYAGAVRPGPGA